MPYSSPLHILPPGELTHDEAADDTFLLRLRKKLLAEYHLTNEAEITINGKAYTKDEIIKTIDVLLGNPDLPLHSYIFKQAELLNFLEGKSNQFNYTAFLNGNPPEELLPAIHNLLIEEALAHFKKHIQARDFAAAEVTANLLKQIPGYQTDEYYQTIYTSLENIRALVRSEKQGEMKESQKKLAFLKDTSFAHLLNILGADFIDTINTLVADIINFMVAYQKAPKVDRGFLYTVSRMLTNVSCDSELEELIKNNHKAFSANYLGNTSTSGNLSPGRIIYIVLIVVVFIARGFVTCDHQNATFSPANFSMQNIQASLQQHLVDKLKTVREQAIFEDLHSTTTGLYTSVDSVMLQGKNPFSFIANHDDETLGDSSKLYLKLINHTGSDLVVIQYKDEYVHSRYIYKDSSLNYFYPKGYTLCFYAGNNWMKFSSLSLAESNFLKYNFENKFRYSPPGAKKLFLTDYTVSLTDKKAKRRKKTNPYPVELTSDFISTGIFKSNFIQFNITSVPPDDKNTSSLAKDSAAHRQ